MLNLLLLITFVLSSSEGSEFSDGDGKESVGEGSVTGDSATEGQNSKSTKEMCWDIAHIASKKYMNEEMSYEDAINAFYTVGSELDEHQDWCTEEMATELLNVLLYALKNENKETVVNDFPPLCQAFCGKYIPLVNKFVQSNPELMEMVEDTYEGAMLFSFLKTPHQYYFECFHEASGKGFRILAENVVDTNQLNVLLHHALINGGHIEGETVSNEVYDAYSKGGQDTLVEFDLQWDLNDAVALVPKSRFHIDQYTQGEKLWEENYLDRVQIPFGMPLSEMESPIILRKRSGVVLGSRKFHSVHARIVEVWELKEEEMGWVNWFRELTDYSWCPRIHGLLS